MSSATPGLRHPRATFVRPPPSRARTLFKAAQQWALLLLIILAGLSVLAWLTVLPSAGLLYLTGAV